MRITMAQKIICIVVTVLFLINDICFGLGVMPGSTNDTTKIGMYAAAQRLLVIGRGTPTINFGESNISRRFEGGRGLIDPKTGAEYIGYASPYQTSSVPVDYENPPTGWKNNPILKETDLIKAFEMFRDTQARIPADRLEIKEGWFPVNEDAGELPIARIERTGEGKYILIIHTKFVRMWNHIRENDVWFELYMGKYDRRTVSAAWGIFYRLAKHEMAELSKLRDTVKSAGHISYNPESLPQDDETLANEIGGNYALVNDAIWLWFLGSYGFNDMTRHDNDKFLKRIDWFFDSPEARALKLHLEFPNLEKDKSKRMLARAFAFTINHDFFNRPNIRGPKDLNSPVNPEFIEQYKERLALRKKLGITEAYISATGADKPDKKEEPGQEVPSTNAPTPIDEIKKANTPVELLPDEMQTLWFTFRFNRQLKRLTKGRPDAVEKQFAIARQLAKLIQTLDSFEGKYYYSMEHWRDSDGKPFSRRGFARFNKKRALQILRKSDSITDVPRMIGIANRIAQDIKAQIESNEVYRLTKIGSWHERIDDILVKVDLLPLIDKALPAYMGGLKFEAIVKGLVFSHMDPLVRSIDFYDKYGFKNIYVPQIDIEPTEPAQDKPAASQPVKQAIEEPAEQPAAKSQKQDITKEEPGQEIPTTETQAPIENQPDLSNPSQIIIGGYPAYTGDSGIKEPPLIKDISDYIVNVGLDKGPGAVELPPDVTADIYKMINLLHDSQIEIFVPQSFKLTANMKKALKDIGKREGRDPIQCREYTDDRHLLELLRKAPVPGVKRMVLEEPQDKKSDFLGYYANENLEAFRFIRLLSVSLPQGYQEMESGVKTVHQAKMMTMAILARLFEKDKTPMVETLLRGMLRESLYIDDDAFTRFMNELGMSDEEINNLSLYQVGQRIIYFLGKPIRLVEEIGREIHLMKAFWTAA